MLGWLSIPAILTEKYAAKAQEASLKVIVSVLLTTDDRESQIHAALSWIFCFFKTNLFIFLQFLDI